MPSQDAIRKALVLEAAGKLSPHDQELLRKLREQGLAPPPVRRETLGPQGLQVVSSAAPQGQFGRGVAEGFFGTEEPLKDIVSGFRTMFTDPKLAADLIFNELPRAMVQAQRQQQVKAATRTALALSGEGSKLAAAGEALGAVIPVLGPAAAATGELIPEEPERGVGQAVGLVGGLALGSKARTIQPRRIVGEPAITRAAERTGALGVISRGAETIVEKSLPGSIGFEPFRKQQQAALLTKIDSFLSEVDPARLSPEQVGKLAGGDVVVTLQDLKKQASALYGEIDDLTGIHTERIPRKVRVETSLVDEAGKPITRERTVFQKVDVSDVMPETRELKKFAIEELRRLRRLEKIVDPETFSQARSSLERVVRSPKRVPFQVMQDARSELLSITRRNDSLLGTRGVGAVKKLSGLADSAIEQAALKSKNPEILQKVREANDFWRKIAEKTERTFDVIEDVAKARPEDAARQLSSLPLEALRDLRGALRPQTWKAMKSTWLKEGFLRAIEAENLRPELGIFNVPPEVRGEVAVLKPAAWQRWLEGQGARTAGEAQTRLGEILSKSELRFVEEILTEAKKAQPSKGGILLPVLNAGLIADTFRGIITADAARIGQNLGVAATLWALSKIMTKPEGIIVARRFIRATGNADQVRFWGARVAQLANEVASEEQQIPAEKPSLRTTIRERLAASAPLLTFP